MESCYCERRLMSPSHFHRVRVAGPPGPLRLLKFPPVSLQAGPWVVAEPVRYVTQNPRHHIGSMAITTWSAPQPSSATYFPDSITWGVWRDILMSEVGDAGWSGQPSLHTPLTVSTTRKTVISCTASRSIGLCIPSKLAFGAAYQTDDGQSFLLRGVEYKPSSN